MSHAWRYNGAYACAIGTSTRTTVSWSWPVSLQRRWTAGRPPSSGPEFIRNATWYEHMHVNARTQTHTHTHTRTHEHTHTQTHTHMHARMNTHTCTQTHTHMQASMNTQTCTQAHKHTLTRAEPVYSYIQILICMVNSLISTHYLNASGFFMKKLYIFLC